MNATFITNASSGRRRDPLAIHELIEKYYRTTRHEFTLAPCSRKEDLDDIIARAIAAGSDTLFAVGGDGTVNEVGKRLIGRELTLGIIPTGSGNGFARHLGIPMDPGQALASSLDARTEVIDTATVNGVPFLGTSGIGFDALIAERFSTSNVRGLQTYVRECVSSLLSYKPAHYEVTVDGRRLSQRAFLIAVANSSQYGNEARIAPHASLQDGLLDISIVTDAPLLAAPLLMGRLFLGQLEGSPHVTLLAGSNITIVREEGGPAHVDGEPMMLGETLVFSIVPRSLRVLVPKSMGGV